MLVLIKTEACNSKSEYVSGKTQCSARQVIYKRVVPERHVNINQYIVHET